MSPKLASARCGRSYLNCAVIITMAPMLVVEMTGHEIVGVIAVRNRFMPAAWAVTVSGVVTAAGVSIRTFLGVFGIHRQLVFVDMIAMYIVHVAIVKEALVPIVRDGRMAAVGSMLMRVPLMSFMIHRLALQ